MDLASIALGTLVVVLSAALVALLVKLRQESSRYKPIIDAEGERRRILTDAKRKADEVKAQTVQELDRLQKQIEEQRKNRDALTTETAELTVTQQRLHKEVSALEENLEDISFGIYKPHFEYDTSESYKLALEGVTAEQRSMVQAGTASHCAVEWSVGGSRRDGERMQKQYGKLLLRAFNGESEAAIAKVAWNNVTRMEERIRNAFTAINALGGVMQVSITAPYMELKIKELRLAYEYEEKKHAELEEQRKIREQMREEERAQREAEAARIQAEKDEAQAEKALEKARVEAAHAEGKEHARMTQRILELEEALKTAQHKRERAKALGELTRAGYVYVLSNIGAFGEHVFKIGMTRRYDPMDRVKELSDAAVPFSFDVHAMVFSEDAPAVETAFHEHFAERNVNLLNLRKEFFRVSIEELQEFADERGLKIAFTKVPEAREYRETVARREANGEHPLIGKSDGHSIPTHPNGNGHAHHAVPSPPTRLAVDQRRAHGLH